MKKGIFVISFILFLLFLGGNLYASAKSFGIGVILGEPTGLSAKLFLLDNSAIDFAAAWSFSHNTSMQIHIDYLWHYFNLIRPLHTSTKFPLYFGIGPRFSFHYNDNKSHHNDEHLGIRFPVGLSALFQKVPIELFLEVAPILDVIPDTDVEFNGGLGIRYYF